MKINVLDQSEEAQVWVNSYCSHNRSFHYEDAYDDYFINGVIFNDTKTIKVCDHDDEEILDGCY